MRSWPVIEGSVIASEWLCVRLRRISEEDLECRRVELSVPVPSSSCLCPKDHPWLNLARVLWAVWVSFIQVIFSGLKRGVVAVLCQPLSMLGASLACPQARPGLGAAQVLPV